MTPEEDIKQFGVQRGALKVGIASVLDINKYAPKGHRPDDFLTGAKSAIVLAGYETTRGAWRSPHPQAMSFNADFFRVRVGMTLPLAKYIESKYGYYTIADVPPIVGWNGSLSFKLCAEMAGMGTRAMAGGVILNREFGLLNLAVVITTMPLVPDGRLKEPVCPSASCVKLWESKGITPCLETCPECLSGELEKGRIKWARYDRRICTTRSCTMHPASYQRVLSEAFDQADQEVRKTILLGKFARSAFQTVATSSLFGQCGECLRYCPICIKPRILKGNDEKSGVSATT